jgi:acyl carrier protein
MSVLDDIKMLLDRSLGLNGKSASFTESTPLLGNIPELDSMAVVTLMTSIEEHFGIIIEDDEVDAETFETLGSLVAFVQQKGS